MRDDQAPSGTLRYASGRSRQNVCQRSSRAPPRRTGSTPATDAELSAFHGDDGFVGMVSMVGMVNEVESVAGERGSWQVYGYRNEDCFCTLIRYLSYPPSEPHPSEKREEQSI